MMRYRHFARVVGALAIASTCGLPARAQVAPIPVVDAAAVFKLSSEITNQLNEIASLGKQLTTLNQQYGLMMDQIKTNAFNTTQLSGIISTFKTVTTVPNILSQNAGQTASMITQFQKLFPGYTVGSSYADYANSIAVTTAAAQQNTLAQAAQYNADLGTTQLILKQLQKDGPPTSELEALRVTSVLLQQDIEQLGKMGALLSTMNQSMATYYGKEVALQSAALTKSCESDAHVVYQRAVQLDPNITMAMVKAALAGTQNCANANNVAP